MIATPMLVGDSLAWLSSGYMHMETVAYPGIKTATGLEWARERPVHRTIYVSLGTNDDPQDTIGFSRLVARFVRYERGACIIWADLYRPGGWRLNHVLRARARKTPNFFVVRWREAVRTGKVHLVDGIHPDDAGNRIRARMMLNTAKKCR